MSIQVPEGYREIEGSERHPSPDATVVGRLTRASR